jgi:hypothetical protein
MNVRFFLHPNRASPHGHEFQFLERTTFDKQNAYPSELEAWIDHFDRDIPPLRNFILPVRVIFGYFRSFHERV